ERRAAKRMWSRLLQRWRGKGVGPRASIREGVRATRPGRKRAACPRCGFGLRCFVRFHLAIFPYRVLGLSTVAALTTAQPLPASAAQGIRRLWLIRHAQSEGNADKRLLHAVADHALKLSPEGVQQARETGRRLKARHLPDCAACLSPFNF